MSVNGMVSVISVIVSFIVCAFSQSCSHSTTCTSIYDCPPILNTIPRSLNSSQAESLRRLVCTSGPGRYPYVCCPQETSTSNVPQHFITRPSNGRGNVLPGKGSCGVQSFGERIYSGRSTALDEFPWMALLEYSRPLTAEVCLSTKGRYLQRHIAWLVKLNTKSENCWLNVRLGEYDISNTTDCIKMDCADPVKNIGIEEVIAHPKYNEKNRNRTNDIGLVRLSEDVPYSDFVKPICLPSTLGATRSEAMSSLQVAGWGRTLNSRQSNTKQKLEVPVIDHAQCQQKFATTNTFIDDSQLCAGGLYIQSACDGDSGGPLMKFAHNYWVVEGIVSFGLACELEGWPGVSTRVSSFEDWIKASMRP